MGPAEANFCADGLHAVAASVVTGSRGPDVLFGELHCICEGVGPHVEQCVRLFHHRTVRMPGRLAVAALDRCHKQRAQLPRFATALLQCLVGTKGAMNTAGRSRWRRHPVVAAAVAHRLATHSLRAEELLAVAVHMPRAVVLRARPQVISTADAAAEISLRSYQEWLTAAAVRAPTALPPAWAEEVLAVAATALAARGLPPELVELVLAHVRL